METPKHFTLYDIKLAEKITLQGRCILQEMVDKLKENGFELKGIKKVINK